MADLVMPKIGLTMTEGLLSEWHVAPGDNFSKGQLLYTVETEKVANEVEAENDGRLIKILIAEGETAAVGTVVAQIAGNSGDQETPEKNDASVKAEQTQTVSGSTITGVEDAPSARKMMAEHGLDRHEMEATGRDGRVLKEDVLRVIATPLARRVARNENVPLHGLSGSGAGGRIKVVDVEAAARASEQNADTTHGALQEEIPDAARLATARRVTASKRDIPHFYVTHEAEISALMALRQELNSGQSQMKISVTHMLIKAIGLTLAELPHLNRIWSDDRIITFDRADVGMVTETPHGLRIPVLRDIGSVPLDHVTGMAHDVANRARGEKLTSADVGDSVIAVSNVGMFGVSSLTPIINPPNAMILGVGVDRRLFRPGADNAPELRHELTLTLACDHRIIDGADAARFLSYLVDVIEQPIRLLRPSRHN